jgi:hypothetical protein
MSEKKSIRIQLDMIYNVPSEKVDEISSRDKELFEQLGLLFDRWGEMPNEVREPIKYDFRHHVGDVIDDNEEAI